MLKWLDEKHLTGWNILGVIFGITLAIVVLT